MNEPEVVSRTHDFLARWTLEGERVGRVFTDPHHTLVGNGSLSPFQRFRIEIAGQAVHPDLLAQQVDSGSLIAVEAKGDGNLLQGVAQAESYLNAVQRSFVALPRSRISEQLVDHARQRGVGVLAVDEQVKPLWTPPARRPLDKAYRSLLSDIECVSWVNEAGAYSFNLPTHYLAWTLLLPIEGSAEVRGLCVSDLNYPMPRDRRAALRGACKLGLVELDGRQARLSDAGRAMRRLLPPSIESWAEVHRALLAGGASTTLAQVSPPSAAGLSMLLLQDPVVRLVMNGLRGVGRDGVDFSGLACLCAAVDPRRAAIFFLKPEAAAARMRADGSVDWARIESADYRSTTFFQYKSILKHAGLIAPMALGAASSKRYRPEQDRWAMFEPGA